MTNEELEIKIMEFRHIRLNRTETISPHLQPIQANWDCAYQWCKIVRELVRSGDIKTIFL